MEVVLVENKFAALFQNRPALIGMLHLGGSTREDRVEQAMLEMDMMARAGFDAVIVENYFGDIQDMQRALERIFGQTPPLKIGVNVLGNTAQSFHFAKDFPIDFIQIDSVCGHLPPDIDNRFAEILKTFRDTCSAAILGGVRFKYQLVQSGRSEEEDLRLGMERCDAIVVTSDRTGKKTDSAKIKRFRKTLGPEFPLIAGAGLTAETVRSQLAQCEGGIVGSWLKENHVDHGLMVEAHVQAFAQAARNEGAESCRP